MGDAESQRADLFKDNPVTVKLIAALAHIFTLEYGTLQSIIHL